MLPPGRNGKINTGNYEAYNSDRYPAFLSPWPLSEKYFLAACRPAWDRPWGIYLVDVFDNMLLLHEDAKYALYEPVPLQKRRRPPVIPDRVDLARKDAEVYLADIYRGPGLAGVPRGTVKALRLYALDFGYRDHVAFGGRGTFDVRRILGTVPVEADGSASFRVPANTPISFQPLDEQGCAMQLMRSWYTAMPGERIGCVGCHERPQEVPGPTVATAFRKPPAEIQPWRGPARGFSYAREVLPVLKRHCAGCHNGKDAPDVLKTPMGGSALKAYLSRPPTESNYHLIPPGEYHADKSKLIHMLRKGHHGVEPDAELLDRLVTWNDLGGPTIASWREHGGIPYNQETRRLETLRQLGCVGLAELPLPPVDNSPVQPLMPKVAATSPAAPVTCPNWPFDKDEAVRRQKAAGAVTERSVTIGTDAKGTAVVLDMVRIPAGEFVMGSTNGFKDEMPATCVRIERPFWISRCEISKEQFQQFDPSIPSASLAWQEHPVHPGTAGRKGGDPSVPFASLSWDQAMAFCQWLSQQTGQKFSLPTEAQWDYACRAGSAEPPVGRDPNAWGLADMLGGAAEWTLSRYRPYPYADNDGRNDPNAAGLRVIRGGSFFGHPATSSARWGFSHWLRLSNVGFRVVCEDDPQTAVRKPSP
jgi:formylglycine-generating enzyme required for sulfatase activity